jgi:hypothetical protein
MNELMRGFSMSSQMVLLPSSTAEHKDIKACFEKTAVGFHILTIERVQNLYQWNFYELYVS